MSSAPRRRSPPSRPVPALAALLLLAGAAPARGQQESDDAEAVVTSLAIFAGAASGLWQSSDWGGSWQRARGAAAGDSLDGVGAVHAIHTTTTNVYLAAETGLYVSQDFGRSWQKSQVDLSARAVLPSRYPQADPTIFVATAEGLLRSIDAGATFERTPLWGETIHRLEWPGPELVAATGRGVSISADGGESFRPAGRGLPEAPVRALALSSMWAMDPVILVGSGGGGVYRSSDGGASWVRVGLEGHGVNDLFWFGPLLYAATGRGLYLSQDAGDSWRPLGEGLTGVEPLRLLFPRYPQAGDEVFLATSRGVYRSLDGGRHWQSSGLRGERVLAVSTFPPPETSRDPR